MTGDKVFLSRSGTVIQHERLFGLAVHRIHEFNFADAEVVSRFDLDEHLFNVGWLDIATWFLDRDRRRHVVERVHDVFDGSRDFRSVFRGQLDAIEAVFAHHELTDERRVVGALHRHR